VYLKFWNLAGCRAFLASCQFVLHAKALPGNPYDVHTLRAVIDQKLTGLS
jgi:hypothetical protein